MRPAKRPTILTYWCGVAFFSAIVLQARFVPPAIAEQNKIVGILRSNGALQPEARLPTKLPPEIRQLLVATAPDWDSHRGRLWVFHQPQPGSGWQQTLFPGPIPVLLGGKGLVWGSGALLNPKGQRKQERDGRAPAGCFAIGQLYGYSTQPPDGTRIPYHQVGQWDAWPDDPNNPFYNRHVVIDPRNGIPPWFEKQKMRHGDFAYEWLLEVRHNSDPPVPGAGSAIFFHIRRGPDRATNGCTMEKPNLVKIIQAPPISSSNTNVSNPTQLPALTP
jgi:hypothetical protein